MNLLVCAQLVMKVFALPSTLTEARKSPQFFSRVRKMSFSALLEFLLRGRKCATQANLNEFFMNKGKGQHMTQQALSKARSHFDHTPFSKAFYEVRDAEYSPGNDEKLKRFQGYKIFAVDGSIIALSNIPKLKELFGEVKDSPSARASIAYDVMNDRIVEAELATMATDERTLALLHLQALEGKIKMEDVIFIFDRGYAARELILRICSMKSHFLMRVRRKFNLLIDNAPMGDSTVEIAPKLLIRVVKFELPSGEVETLITDLFDIEFSQFQELYFLRWPVEVKYDIVKNKLELPNFSGTSETVIMQDFWISMLLANIAAIAKAEADIEIKEARKGKQNKYEYQANVNNVIAVVRNRFADALFNFEGAEREAIINEIICEISASVVPIRKGRTIPRKQARKVKFHHTKKSNV